MPEQPTGTVTFLFTDIEGSTSRWEHQPEAMKTALARHHVLLRETIEGQGGYVFQIVGDAFCAAFATASAALAAADAAQYALHVEPWGETGALRVRMALYTGEAEASDGDYHSGPPLNRVSRLLSSGHGGQILLSLPTYSLIRDALPQGSDLRDLGEHYLRDLSWPEHIFQLVSPNWPADTRPLKTLNTRPNNLAMQPTALVGREQDVAAVQEMLARDDVRLVTLTGPGGTGKTRLALQVGAELIDGFEDGVYFVALDFVFDPHLVAPTIAQTVGVREGEGAALVETLKEYLRTKHILLLLDNFEQIVAAAPLVADLLSACPRLKIVATSRTVLRLRGEHEYPVPPLVLPDPKHLPPAERLSQYAAVALFVERALAVKPDFAITNENAAAVAEICARLDGLPLAIELAAARIKLFPPPAMLARLQSRLSLLTGGGRELSSRQRTLRGAIDWGYNLLSAPEQNLFRRLAVFVGGCTLEAAAAVCDADGDLGIDILDGVASLVDNSLLRQAGMGEQTGEPRFLMLETLREYGLECLTAGGEAADIRRHHAEHFLRLAEEAEPRLIGAEQAVWLDRLETEHGNLREALEWSKTAADDVETGLRLAGALSRFWWVRGHLSEGRRWLETMLAGGGTAPAAVRAKALHAAANLALPHGDYERATALYEEALALRRELRDTRGIALSLYNLGNIAKDHGDYARASSLYQESLGLRRELGDPLEIAASLQNLGDIARYEGDYERATTLLEEALALRRTLRDKMGTAAALSNLGQVAQDRGDYAQASALLEESLALFRELGTKLGVATSLQSLGDVARHQGDYAQASTLLEESLALFRELGTKFGIALVLASLGVVSRYQGKYARATALLKDSLTLRQELEDERGIVDCLEALGMIASAEGQPSRAVRLFGAAEALREAIHVPLPTSERVNYVRSLAATRAVLGSQEFAVALAEGRAMVLDQSLAYALDLVTQS
jgi:predicted ATPase/class 3 adenylate cyclase/uncharacterized protein HemY